MRNALVLCAVTFVSAFVPGLRAEWVANTTVGQLLAEVAATRENHKIAVIGLDGADDTFLIPGAGNAIGGGGSLHFKSDVTIINYRSTAQRIHVAWLQQGVNNCSAPVFAFDLGTGWRYYEDFVGTVLNKSGLGSLLFIAVNSAGEPDTLAQIDGTSRIWTRQPGSTGTVSQPFASTDPNDLTGTERAYIIGLRHDNAFRTNVGVVNLNTTSARRWNVEIYGDTTGGSGTVPIDVQPCSMALTSAPSGNWGAALVSLVPEGGSGNWSGYASSTDNVTGDAWIVRAIQ